MATGRNSYRPVIQPEYVHLIGDTIFAIPENFNESTVSIKIKTPETWVFASDLEAEGLNVDALRSSVMVAGDFRIESRPVDNAVLRVALRGDWDFTDAHFADMVQRVVQANHTYWGDPGEDFLVTVLPLEADPGSQSMGGTSRTDAFAFFATANLDENTAIQILTHEHAHTWNPRRLGGGYDEDEEAAGYWFSEGFTDFLTQRIGVSAGLWTATDSLSRWNEVLSEYALSPENTASNSKIRDGFWDNRDLNRLPYIRGMLFAAHAEYRIRSGSEGRINLNDVMKAMRRNNNEIDAAPGSFVDQTLATTGIDLTLDYLPTTWDPPTNLAVNDNLFTWDAPGAGGEIEELIYDNGTSTGAYSYLGYSMGTQMSPAEPCQILELKVHTSDGANFNAEVWGWDAGAPTEDLYYQENVDAAFDDWVIVDVSGENLMFDGDFVVAFGSVDSNTYMSYDAGLNNGRSWDHADAGGWASWSEAYLVRAVVQYSSGAIAELAPTPIETNNNQAVAAGERISIDVIDHNVDNQL